MVERQQGQREFDIIIWGASGFTGRLVVEYLAERYGIDGDLRWAMGGRNEQKLHQVRDQVAGDLSMDLGALPLVVGDAADALGVAQIAERTSVMCTTVGPYAKYGSLLVDGCVRHGTHYCDLAGEVQWMRKMIDKHDEGARASGARIVHTCGFDCIPSDLGVHFIQREMEARHGATSAHVKLRVKGFGGGASGGTIASMLNMMEEAGRDRDVRRVMADPYGLNPSGERSGPDGGDSIAPYYDPDFGQWVGPFVMAAVNTRVVRRTNALTRYKYGREFRYDEGMLMGSGPGGIARSAGMAAGLGGGMAAMAVGPIRKAVSRWLPAPGEGPSKEEREKGYFDLRLWAKHPDDPSKNLRARVTGDRDPGYGSTAKMLGESAVCLAKDDLAVGGGFWTPASAMGDALIDRLQAKAGLEFSIVDEE